MQHFSEELCEWRAPKLDAGIKLVKLLETKRLVKKYTFNICDTAFIFLPVPVLACLLLFTSFLHCVCLKAHFN